MRRQSAIGWRRQKQAAGAPLALMIDIIDMSAGRGVWEARGVAMQSSCRGQARRTIARNNHERRETRSGRAGGCTVVNLSRWGGATNGHVHGCVPNAVTSKDRHLLFSSATLLGVSNPCKLQAILPNPNLASSEQWPKKGQQGPRLFIVLECSQLPKPQRQHMSQQTAEQQQSPSLRETEA